MNDFPYLLVRAWRATGTVLDVAMLLQVQPAQVHRWIAGIDLPSDQRIGDFTTRLQRVLYRSTSAATPLTQPR
jgi:hypothetical protein